MRRRDRRIEPIAALIGWAFALTLFVMPGCGWGYGGRHRGGTVGRGRGSAVVVVHSRGGGGRGHGGGHGRGHGRGGGRHHPR
jgi:hypothetical protein